MPPKKKVSEPAEPAAWEQPSTVDREDEVNSDVVQERNHRPGAQAVDEVGLSDNEIVARRTPGNWPADGRFRRVFHVERPRVSRPEHGEAAGLEENDENESFHNANKVATLQFAMQNGLHPRGPAELERIDVGDSHVDLVYAVDVVPASTERPEETALTYTPSAALGDLGGTTVAEREIVHPDSKS